MRAAPLALLLIGGLVLGGCQPAPPPPKPKDGPDLVVRNAVIGQTQPKQKTAWKLTAPEITYRSDRQIGLVRQPVGTITREGQLIYRITADRGEVEGDGQRILLRGNVRAKRLTGEVATLQGETLIWRPQEGSFELQKQVRGESGNLRLIGEAGQFDTRRDLLQMQGTTQVVQQDGDRRTQIVSRDPLWQLALQQIVCTQPIQAERFQGRDLVARGSAQRGVLQIQASVAQLSGNVLLTNLRPAAVVSSQELIWALKANQITSPTPLTVDYQTDGSWLRGDRGSADLTTRNATLEGNAQRLNRKDGSRLFADRLNWMQQTQQVIASGRVRYSQPRLRL